MPKLYVKKSGIHMSGVFAGENISKGVRIIECTGERISNEEADKRELENAKRGATYIFWLNETTSIDGSVGGNISRYVNHSCNPNLIYVVKNERVFLYAKSNIKKDEELTFDYSFDRDEKKELCCCKSKNCRGFINEP